jgi:hypothetical protein
VQGTPIKGGALVRLQHVATRKWLHSHKFPSPMSNQQEVRWGPLHCPVERCRLCQGSQRHGCDE